MTGANDDARVTPALDRYTRAWRQRRWRIIVPWAIVGIVLPIFIVAFRLFGSGCALAASIFLFVAHGGAMAWHDTWTCPRCTKPLDGGGAGLFVRACQGCGLRR